MDGLLTAYSNGSPYVRYVFFPQTDIIMKWKSNLLDVLKYNLPLGQISNILHYQSGLSITNKRTSKMKNPVRKWS